MASGTTAIAAKMTQRHYLGYKISREYCELALKRIAAVDTLRPTQDRPPASADGAKLRWRLRAKPNEKQAAQNDSRSLL